MKSEEFFRWVTVASFLYGKDEWTKKLRKSLYQIYTK